MLRHLLPAGLIRQPAQFAGRWRATIALSLMVNLLLLIQPLFMLHVYDYVLPSQSLSTLAFLSVIALFVLAASGGLDYLRSCLLIDIGHGLETEIRGRCVRAVISEGSAKSRSAAFARDLGAVRNFVAGGGLTVLLDLPWTPIYVLALFVLSPWLGVIGVALTLLASGIGLAAEGRLKALAARAQATALAERSLIDELAGSPAAARSMGFADVLAARWSLAASYAQGVAGQGAVETAAVQSAVRSVRLGSQIIMLTAAAVLVLQQKLSPGGMVAASLIGARAMTPLDALLAGARQRRAAQAALRALEALAARADQDARPRTCLPGLKGGLALEGVCLVDPGSRRYRLQSVSMTVQPGELVALIGRAGSGKSSLLQVMAGVAEPSLGLVRIDGSDRTHWSDAEIGRHVGYLTQDAPLYRGTVAENIRRFGEEADDGAVVAAAQLCGAHALIQSLPDGYETQVFDGGVTLSKGQRQAIALARAVYGAPSVLLLDEPAAQLDGDAEQAFWRMVAGLKGRGCTVIFSTFRPSHIGLADRVALMAGGRLCAYGPPGEVLSLLRPPAAAGPKPPAQVPAAPAARAA